MIAQLRHALLFAVALLSVAAPSVSSQTLPGEIERDQIKNELRHYLGVIRDYRRGRADAVDRLLAWDTRRFGRIFAALEGPHDESRPWEPSRFKSAAMVHTDAALRLIERSDLEAALVHLDAASQLLQKGKAELRPYAARWYQAAARLLQNHGSRLLAEQFLETARTRLPNDSMVLFESGTLHERMASDSVMPIVVYAPDLRAPSNADPGGDRSNRRITREDVDTLKTRRIDNLNRAAGFLRESLAADASNLPAQLHLGRVESLRQKNDDALTLLRQTAASQDPKVAYLALLFTGALHEREGSLEASADAYRAAIGRFPRGHAAYIALSAVLQRSGHADQSRAILGRVVDGAIASRREPWWTYLAEPRSLNVERFDQLRREARQ